MVETIPFVVDVPEGDESRDTKGGLFTPESGTAVRNLPVERLRANLGAVCSSMLHVLKDIQQVGKFQLHEVALEVEVNAEGGVNLIGTTKVGGKGAIKLLFKEGTPAQSKTGG